MVNLIWSPAQRDSTSRINVRVYRIDSAYNVSPRVRRLPYDTLNYEGNSARAWGYVALPFEAYPRRTADLGWGWVRFTAFDSLFIDVPKFYSISIYPYSDSLIISETRSVVDEMGDSYTKADSVRIGSVMRAELTGSHFEIRPSGDTQDQPLTRTGPTVWAWMIEPKKLGEHELVLIISVVQEIEGVRLPQVSRVLRRSVHIVPGLLQEPAYVPRIRAAGAFQPPNQQQVATSSLRKETSADGPIEADMNSTPAQEHDTGSSTVTKSNTSGLDDPPSEDDTDKMRMSSRVVIGIVFLGALVLFLMVAYYVQPNSPYAYAILKLISALCGGFAGGLFTGEAVVEISKKANGGLEYGLSGTAGFALFLIIWKFFPPPESAKPPHPSHDGGVA